MFKCNCLTCICYILLFYIVMSCCLWLFSEIRMRHSFVSYKHQPGHRAYICEGVLVKTVVHKLILYAHF